MHSTWSIKSIEPSWSAHDTLRPKLVNQSDAAAVGIEADSERVEALLKELEGKDITEVIAAGVSKLASVPAGGGGVAAAGGMSLGRARHLTVSQ